MLIELLTKRYPGMRFWLMQRIAAVVMAVYFPLAMLYFLIAMPVDYDAWLQFNQPIWWRVVSVINILSICLHAWIGVRDVLRDYVPSLRLRDVLQALIEVSLVAYVVWAISIFLDI